MNDEGMVPQTSEVMIIGEAISIARATQHEKAGKSHSHVPSSHVFHKNVFSIM